MSVLLAVYLLADDAAPDGPKAGDIVRKVTCSDSLVASAARDGEGVLEVTRGTIFNDLTHRVDLTTMALVEK